jgi:hypothetical protein
MRPNIKSILERFQRENGDLRTSHSRRWAGSIAQDRPRGVVETGDQEAKRRRPGETRRNRGDRSSPSGGE